MINYTIPSTNNVEQRRPAHRMFPSRCSLLRVLDDKLKRDNGTIYRQTYVRARHAINSDRNVSRLASINLFHRSKRHREFLSRDNAAVDRSINLFANCSLQRLNVWPFTRRTPVGGKKSCSNRYSVSLVPKNRSETNAFETHAQGNRCYNARRGFNYRGRR